MPLPQDVLDAQRKMKEAEDALHAYRESGQHDPDKHRILTANLQKAIGDYLERIKSLKP
jgi:hypothetical protein